MTYENLPEEVQAINDKINALVFSAQDEARDLTNLELIQCQTLLRELDTAVENSKSRGRISTPDGPGRKTSPDGPYGLTGLPARARTPVSPLEAPSALFKNLQTGETVHGYRGTAPLSPANDAPLGDTLQAILLNDFSGLPLEIANSLTTGSDTGGGYLVTPTLSQRVIDLARANSVVMKAGATTVAMTGPELALARLTGDPSVTWRGETQTVTASTPTFGRYTLRPKTCAAIVPVSMELLEDTPNAGNVIESALMSKLGTEVDRVILEGVGASNEPLGIVNNTEVNSQTSVGTPTTYGQITTAITSILTANYSGEISDLSWIMNPTIGGTYDGLKTGISSDNTPLEPTPWVRQLMRLYTTNLAASGSPEDYNMIVGDFRECLVGMRTSGVVIDVLDAGQVTDTSSNSWNAASQFLRFIRARIRVDSLLMRPTWFSVLSGVNA